MRRRLSVKNGIWWSCLAVFAWMCLAMTGQAVETPAAPVDAEGLVAHFPPFIENARLADGKHRVWVMLVYHHTTNPDGTTHSRHILNYLQAPKFTAFLPFYYRFGAEGKKHAMVVPLWFKGPGYATAPLALSAAWTRADGGRTCWITPLFHSSTSTEGKLRSVKGGPK